MIEKIMKAVKSGNKKRGRNITVGAVVGMLLSCTAVMGADNYLWIKNDGEIKFSTDNSTPANIENPYGENTWDGADYVNNIALNSTSTDYGLKLEGDLGNVNFTNNGLIGSTGNSTSYGIYNGRNNKIGNIINNGSIIGMSIGSSNGSGINSWGTIEDIINSGLIIGENTGTYSGYGIDSWGTMGNVKNVGLIVGIGNGEGRGISIGGTGKAQSISNDGFIIGISKADVGLGISTLNVIDNIINNGVISSTSDISSRPFYIYGKISNIKNNGLVIGSSTGIGTSYGIYANGGGFGGAIRITNMGSIMGITLGNNAAGINNDNSTRMYIANNGLVMGIGASSSYGIYNLKTIDSIKNTGVIYGKTNTINNNKTEDSTKGTITSIDNYGILATKGTSIIANESGETITENNYGLYIEGTTGIVTVGSAPAPTDIVVGYDESGTEIKREMTIKNAPRTAEGTSTTSLSFSATSNEFDNSILNGKNDTLKVLGNREISGSIINAYGTAVIFDGTDSQFTLSGTIVNGGADGTSNSITGSDKGDTLILEGAEVQHKDIGNKFQQTVINGNIDMGNGNNAITLKNGSVVNGKVATGTGIDTIALENEAVVNGEVATGDGNDNLTISTGAIINGNIAMGNDDDTLNIKNGAQINGTLDGGSGNDILNFNSETTRALGNNEINILHNISNFNSMNINTNVTLFEKTIEDDGSVTNLTVTGANEIKINVGGVLTLRIDPSKTEGSGEIKGHALYGNAGTIKSENNGKLLLALNGAGNESVISFGGTNIDRSLVTAHETKVEEEINFATTSLLHKVKRIVGTTNEVIITSRADLPTDITYEKLNEIYHSILSVDELGNFNVDDDEKLSTFLGYLNDIYAGSPYSYSSELSRKSAGMFRDIVTENIFRPETNKWMIYGGLTHVDGGTKDTYYGKGYYTYDIGSSDMDADTKITGAYMLGEYGVSDTLTSGVVIGGNKLKSDLSNSSKVDGSAMYLGAYAKKYIGNLKVTAGAGFQYGDYDADRMAVNKVASGSAESVMKYSDNYNDMTYDIYLNGRYSHNIGKDLFLEPYATLSYTYIDQDGANEGSKALAIETDSKSFDYTVAKVGVDLKKVIPHEKGKSTLTAGISYTKILDGADEEHITGRFKGGSNFDILVAHKNEHSIGLNAKYALELENGVIFDVKGTYSVERDSHNQSGKNKTKGEWIVGAGIGYKF